MNSPNGPATPLEEKYISPSPPEAADPLSVANDTKASAFVEAQAELVHGENARLDRPHPG